MKKSKETQIMLDALADHAGLAPTGHLECAVNFGLKQIRMERFGARKGRRARKAREWIGS